MGGVCVEEVEEEDIMWIEGGRHIMGRRERGVLWEGRR